MTAGSTTLAAIAGQQTDAGCPKISNDGQVSPTSPALEHEQMLGAQTSARVSVADHEGDYGKVKAKRFKALAVKRALGTANADENREFAELQRARRSAESSFRSEDVIAEHRRRQMFIEFIATLTRHVHFFHSSDQARIKALAEMH